MFISHGNTLLIPKSKKVRLIKNFLITVKSKGIIATFFAIKSFFIILFANFFSKSILLKRNIFNYVMYLDPKDKGISRTLLLFGERELDHKKILEKIIKKGMKIFDIGANIGYYVLMETTLTGNKGKILAIEPVPDNIKLLEKNLELNKNKITKTVQAAISESSEKESFVLSSHSNLGHLVGEEISRLNLLEKKFKKKKIKVINPKIMSLRELIDKTFYPDFIRMDVEGREIRILNNLVSLKLKKYPIVCFETHTSRYQLSHNMTKRNSNISQMEDVLRKMFKKGYEVKLVSSSSERGSNLLKNLGYQSIIKDIKTDDVTREIFTNLSEEDAVNLICYKGGLRTVLLTKKK